MSESECTCKRDRIAKGTIQCPLHGAVAKIDAADFRACGHSALGCSNGYRACCKDCDHPTYWRGLSLDLKTATPEDIAYCTEWRPRGHIANAKAVSTDA